MVLSKISEDDEMRHMYNMKKEFIVQAIRMFDVTGIWICADFDIDILKVFFEQGARIENSFYFDPLHFAINKEMSNWSSCFLTKMSTSQRSTVKERLLTRLLVCKRIT